MKKFVNLLILSAIIISTGMISANMLIGGTAYNQNYQETLEGIEITAICGESNTTTITHNDGTYYFIFENKTCENPDIISSIEKSMITITIRNISSEELPKTIETLEVEKEKPTILGFVIKNTDEKELKNYFLCGNKICEGGESETTCSQDCSTQITTNETLPETINPILSNGKIMSHAKGISIIIAIMVTLSLIFLSRE